MQSTFGLQRSDNPSLHVEHDKAVAIQLPIPTRFLNGGGPNNEVSKFTRGRFKKVLVLSGRDEVILIRRAHETKSTWRHRGDCPLADKLVSRHFSRCISDNHLRVKRGRQDGREGVEPRGGMGRRAGDRGKDRRPGRRSECRSHEEIP